MFETMKLPALKGLTSSALSSLGLGACLLLLLTPAHGASPSNLLSMPDIRLGTLFYSAQERLAITQGRSGESEVESSSIVRVTGIVKRTGGKSTAWINGQAVPEGKTQAPMAKTTISPNSVTVDGQRVRVGEALDLNTHERADIVSPGAVTTQKARP